MIDFMIEKLTCLLIKQDMEEKINGTNIYVKKTEIYRDLIKLLKEIKNDYNV